MSKPQDLDVEQYKKLEQTFKDEFHTSPSVNYYIIATSYDQSFHSLLDGYRHGSASTATMARKSHRSIFPQ
jgi:hypothetical protein